MSGEKAIQIILKDGTLSGVMTVESAAWENGVIYSAPRNSINEFLSEVDCKKYGVYLLLSKRDIYVGQASDLARRTRQHLKEEWWTRVILMTTKLDNLYASDINYLETHFIDLALELNLNLKNARKGNPQKVDNYHKVKLDTYINEALLLLNVIGVNIFEKSLELLPKSTIIKEHKALYNLAQKETRNKPPLPNEDELPNQSPCTFVRVAFDNLIQSGYVFSDEQMKMFSDEGEMKEYTKRNDCPMFWIFKDGESRKTCDQRVRERYWAREYTSGIYRFMMFSQWYNDSTKRKVATKEDFIRWYELL